MKKISIILASLICILSVGCSDTATNADSLQDAYFKIGQKLEDKKELTKDEVGTILNGYKYKKGEEVKDESNEYSSKLHEFTSNNERLTISDSEYDHESMIELTYELKDNEKEVIALFAPSEDNTSSNMSTALNVSSSDIKYHEKISNILSKSSTFKDSYNDIAKKVASDSNTSIDDIKKIIGSEPLVEEDKVNKNTNVKTTQYGFKEGSEIIYIEYIKEGNRLYSVSYANEENFVIKSVINKRLTDKNEKLYTNIFTYVDSINTQKILLNEMIK